MAAGTIVLGTKAILQVSDSAGGPWDDLNEIATISKPDNTPIDKFPRFMGATHNIPGATDATVEVDGYLAQGDDGQNRIRAHAIAKDIMYIKVLPNGDANGAIFPVRAASRNFGQDAKGGLATWKATLAQDGDAVAVGDGGGLI